MGARYSTAALLLALALAPNPGQAASAPAPIVTSQHSFVLSEVVSGLEHAWGFDWLPDGRMLVTERPGRLRIVTAEGTLSAPLSGLPEIVSEFRDGLLDIAVSPGFAEDGTVYFSYSHKEGDKRWLIVAAARLEGEGLSDLRTLHEAEVKVAKDQGFGSRIRFDGGGALLVSVGDHAVPPTAQDTSNTLGTLIRISPDGTPLADNPGAGLHPAIYAYGFKNPQGLTVDPESGTIWALDHGGSGGGEVNRIERGANYGWPLRTFSGGDAPRAVATGEFIDPAFTWGAAPTVAPSGLALYSGADFPAWQGDLFVGSLTQEALIRIMLNDSGAVIGTEYVLDGELGRVREVRQGPDGRLYVANDAPEGGIYRLDPAKTVQ